jgi:hypothetical protein
MAEAYDPGDDGMGEEDVVGVDEGEGIFGPGQIGGVRVEHLIPRQANEKRCSASQPENEQ